MKTITLDVELLNKLDLSSLRQYVEWSPTSQYLELPAGKEHYRMISYLAFQLKDNENPYVDIGTYTGLSAVALSLDDSQSVITYDVCDWIPDDTEYTCKTKPNIAMKLTNCCNDMDAISKSKLIVLDIDPHDGVEEQVIIDKLQDSGFKGLLVLDDIHLNGDMESFWESISLPKLDVTKYGHWSGTGIVNFDCEEYLVELI